MHVYILINKYISKELKGAQSIVATEKSNTIQQHWLFFCDSLENSEAKPAGKSHTIRCLKSPVIAVELSD